MESNKVVKKTNEQNGGANGQFNAKNAQSRNWTGTYFGTDIDSRIDELKLQCLYFMAQIELCPKTNREHLQFFVHFNVNWRMARVKGILPGAHCEVARDSDACIRYCSKEESRIRGPFSHGVAPKDRQKQGKKLTVREALELSEDQLQELPAFSYVITKKALALVPRQPTSSDVLRGEWYHGPPGSGKSRLVHDTYPGAYIKMQNKWFDNYQGQDIIIMDDLDVTRGSPVSKEIAHMLKIVSDHYECTGEVKGGYVALQHTKFVVTSNYTPEDLWDDPVLVEAINRRFIFKLIA